MGTPPKKIFLIDDNDEALSRLEKKLSGVSCEVEKSTDPDSAVEKILEGVGTPSECNLAIIQIGMRGLSGLDIGEALRVKGFNKRIVGVTKHATLAEKKKCFKAGFDGYFTVKSLKAELLKALLDES